MLHPPNRQTTWLIRGLLLGLAGAVAINTFAAGNALDTDPRVFPYNGVLELNGTGYTGTADLKFTVSDDGTCTFEETHSDVSVYSGRFSVNIGAKLATGVPDCVFDASRVYISVAVRQSGTDGGAFASLTGRQRIRPVPFALWSAEGSNFEVDGTITATGAISGASVTSTGNTTVGNRLEVQGPDIKLGTSDGRTGSDSNQYALSHLGDGSDKLSLNYGSAFTGGVEINGPVRLLGGTTVGTGKPASGLAQLALGNSSDDALDNINDYQIQLWSGNNANNTYGLGILTSAIFFNSNRYYRFYVNGSEKFVLDGSSNTATFNTSATFTGDISASNNSWSDCVYEGFTTGTSANGEELFGECSGGRFVVGYRRWHGSFDYGIEQFELKCCRL